MGFKVGDEVMLRANPSVSGTVWRISEIFIYFIDKGGTIHVGHKYGVELKKKGKLSQLKVELKGGK